MGIPIYTASFTNREYGNIILFSVYFQIHIGASSHPDSYELILQICHLEKFVLFLLITVYHQFSFSSSSVYTALVLRWELIPAGNSQAGSLSVLSSNNPVAKYSTRKGYRRVFSLLSGVSKNKNNKKSRTYNTGTMITLNDTKLFYSMVRNLPVYPLPCKIDQVVSLMIQKTFKTQLCKTQTVQLLLLTNGLKSNSFLYKYIELALFL